MASGSEEARFSIKVDADTNSPDALANSMDGVRESIEKNEAAIKTMVASMRMLRGKDEETKKARDQLKASIEAHRKENTKATLEILKQGTSLEALTAKTKKAAEAEKASKAALGNAARMAGGPVADLMGKLESINGVIAGGGGKMLLAAGGVAILTAAVVGLAAASATAIYTFGKFVLESTNLSRTQNLTRLAFTGNAENAKNLGTQVDALARKLPTAKAKLNELASSLAVTRLAGQTQVDTFNLVGQAAEAMGDSVGSKLQEIVTRGQLTRRMFLSPMELLGTGLHFNDVADELAKATNVSVAKAKQALVQGAVPLGVGAEALRKAVEKRFGQVNLMKMLDFDVMKTKAGESLQYLTRNIKTEKLVEGMGKLAKMLGPESMTGHALEKIVQLAGNGLVGALEKSLPVAKAVFQGITISALLLTLAVLKTKNRFEDAFGKDLKKDGITNADDAIKALTTTIDVAIHVVDAIATGIAAIAKAADMATTPVRALGGALGSALGAVHGGWKSIGSAIVDGLSEGVDDGIPRIDKKMKDLADTARDGFRDPLEIASPSRALERDGVDITKGAARGIEKGSPALERTAGGMASTLRDAASPAPEAALESSSRTTSAARGARGGSAPVSVSMTFNIDSSANSKEIEKTITSSSVLTLITKVIEDALASSGSVVNA